MTVKQQQHLLAYLGYYVGAIDGIWGTLSKTATKSFQKDFFQIDSKANGTCDDETEKALTHAVAYGMPAKQVEETTEPENSDSIDGIKHFKRHEFACKCGRYCNGYPTEMKKGVLTVLDRTREHFGSPAIVSSGLRCKQHNANVGGVANSRHLSGKAADFCVKGKTAAQVLAYVQNQPETRCAYAIDNSYVHVDSDIV
jgi:peptidoglycan hydrolase-like protein with peptidoglycan-binding domain